MSMNVKDKTYRELGKLIVISGTMVGILLLNSSLIWAATKSTENVASEEDVLSAMTLEEKVAQMFFVTPEALTGAAFVTEAGEITEERFSEYPVGGIIYFTENICNRSKIHIKIQFFHISSYYFSSLICLSGISGSSNCIHILHIWNPIN